MGFRTLDEIIGRNDLLERVERPDVPRAQMLDLSVLLAPTDAWQRSWQASHPALRRTVERNDRPGLVSLDSEILAELQPYLESGLPFSGSYPIHNHHLRWARGWPARSPSAPATRVCRRARCGSASPAPPGQSFGAFTCRGMHLELEGEANDYVGKGLSGGEITIRPFRRAAYADVSHQHLIIGNTVLYGATGGQALRRGPGRRSVRGPQLRRGRGDRGRGQPLLRVHDRRASWWCSAAPAGTSAPGCRTAWPTCWMKPALSAAGSTGDMVELADLDERDVELLQRLIREHEEQHRESARADDPGAVGGVPAAVPEGCAEGR